MDPVPPTFPPPGAAPLPAPEEPPGCESGAPFLALAAEQAEQALSLRRAGARAICCTPAESLAGCRAALLGARQAALPVFACAAIDHRGRLLLGDDPSAALVTLQALGAAGFALAGPSADGKREALEALEELAQIPLFDADTGRPLFLPHPAGTRDGFLAASAEGVFYLDGEVGLTEPVSCTPDLADTLLARGEEADVLLLRVDTMEDAYSFAQCAHLARGPAAFVSESEEALEMALLLYHGRALVSTMSDIGRPELHRLARAYGGIVV